MSTSSTAKNNLAPSVADSISSWQGTKLRPALFTIAVFLLLWNLPTPNGLTTQAWHLFAIFTSIIFAIIAKPLPMGSLAIIAISVCTLTKTLTIEQSLSSYSSKIIWLVFIAFLLAKGFIKTGLGSRIAYYFVYALGKNTLGLGYGLIFTDLILAPFVPSNTARGAGIVFPIVSALNKEYGSSPDNGTEKKIGAFLIKLCFHANIITSAMFMTAMAVNPLMASLAQQFGITITWFSWAKAAFVPGAISLILLPLILYKINPPEIKYSPEAREFAKSQLEKMGALKKAEWIMLGTFSALISLWVFGSQLGIDATSTAFIGLTILIITGVLSWDDILGEKNAWNTFLWLTTLLMMTNHLAKFGFMDWFGNYMHAGVASYHWTSALLILALVYFYSHYLFASLAAHVSSLYVPFVLVAITTGAPPALAVFLFAYISSLSAAITHYGTGTAPVYFSANFHSVKNWWRIGGIVGIINFAIWFGTGSAWWKYINLW